MAVVKHPLFHPPIVRRALYEALYKLDPRHMVRNPVMFVVYVGSALTTLVLARDVVAGRPHLAFTAQLAAWLWFTILFANFAEAMAEGRGKAQADALRATRQETRAKRLRNPRDHLDFEPVFATELRVGDAVLVKAGDLIPADGDVVEGIASVDEAAVTGESAPVIREPGGDRSAVTGGTRVLSDWMVLRVTANPGDTFVDRMIALVEGASRRRTPNEVALTILLCGLTIVLLCVVTMLSAFASYSGISVPVPVLIALLVCLIPTTIGGLLSAIGIAGMDRLTQHNVIAISGRAVEAAGDVNTLLLDKTGTITLGNRQAIEFVPLSGVAIEELVDRAQLASLADETPEGRSIVVLAKEHFGLRERTAGGNGHSPLDLRALRRGHPDERGELRPPPDPERGDGRDRPLGRRERRRDAARAHSAGDSIGRRAARRWSWPSATRAAPASWAAIHLKDVVKGGIRQRFEPPPRDGDPDGDDHGRQPHHGRRGRRGSRRRRLPRRGDAGAEA